MDKIKEFLKLITSDQYIGWILLGIFILVIIVFICIVTYYQSKKKRAVKEALKYRRTHLSTLSDEELKNIANNVADPNVLYQKLEEQVEEVNAEIEAEKGKRKTKKSTKTTKTKQVEKVESKPEPIKEVKPTVKEEVKQPKKQASTPKKVVYNGKWIIKEDGGKYFAVLLASNGVTVLKTESYASLTGVKNGIETIKKNINVGNFATTVDKNGRYCFKLFSKSNRLICVSDYYSSKAKCEGGINSVKRFAETASIIIEEN
ncbi:MAG: YegP family protein [Clostridia bacterium]|nr:YegP family protein [Clostridia bacterium]